MRIAVIGHGPEPVGQGWGTDIDAHDRVVRLHDWDWQDAGDYGTRYDYGVLPGPGIARALKSAVRAPENGWLVYSPYQPLDRAYVTDGIMGRPVLDVRDHAIAWFERLARFNARSFRGRAALTRGASAILLTAHVLSPTELTLVGFNNIIEGRFGSGYPAACPAQNDFDHPGQEYNHAHDMVAERALVFEALRRYGVRPRLLGQAGLAVPAA